MTPERRTVSRDDPDNPPGARDPVVDLAPAAAPRYLTFVADDKTPVPVDTDDEPVVRLPRGKGMNLDRAMMFRIVTTVALLVMIVVAARPCANATSKFVTDFDDKKGSASDLMPKPGTVDQPTEQPVYEHLGPNMTDEEIRAAIARAKERNAVPVGSGSAVAPRVDSLGERRSRSSTERDAEVLDAN